MIKSKTIKTIMIINNMTMNKIIKTIKMMRITMNNTKKCKD
jgi:hypothetical protein